MAASEDGAQTMARRALAYHGELGGKRVLPVGNSKRPFLLASWHLKPLHPDITQVMSEMDNDDAA